MEDVRPIRRALLSVSDKKGLVELARALADARGPPARQRQDVQDRVTVEPGSMSRRSRPTPASPRSSAAGSRRSIPSSTAASSLAAEDVAPPTSPRLEAPGSTRLTWWSSTSTRSRRPSPRPGVTFEEAIENIDIGGPSLIRGGGPEEPHPFVAVVTDPDPVSDLARSTRRRPAERRCPSAGDSPSLSSSRRPGMTRLIADYLGRAARSTGGHAFPARLSPPSFTRRFNVPPLRREGEPASAGAPFYAEAEPGRPQPGDRQDPPRQRTLVYQPARPRQRPPARPDFTSTGPAAVDPQAQQPLRRGLADDPGRRPSSSPTRATP